MTDEEKASDIYEICLDRKSLCCIRKSGEDTCDKCKTYQMYKIGLEAGRKLGKEEQWKATEKAQKKTSSRIRDLEKENAELKELSEINSLSKVLIQRCKEVGIKDLHQLANYLTIMENQKYQIEKMKCCGNCKNQFICRKADVSGRGSFPYNCKEWELEG